MTEDIIALFIPIVSMAVLGLVLWAFFHYRYKTRVRVQETIQAALERGNELTPDLVDRMAGPKPGEDQDLRRGLIAISIGLAFAVLGLLVDDADAVGPMVGVGSFPFLIGIAYIIMWRFGRREGQR